jgi:hypothetical protein
VVGICTGLVGRVRADDRRLTGPFNQDAQLMANRCEPYDAGSAPHL